MAIKFKHYVTDKIIEVMPVDSEEHEIVYCKEMDKHFTVMRKFGYSIYLKGTSYVLLGD